MTEKIYILARCFGKDEGRINCDDIKEFTNILLLIKNQIKSL